MDQNKEEKKVEEQNQGQGSQEPDKTATETKLLYAELLDMGFQTDHIEKALKLTNEREKAVNLIIQFMEDAENPKQKDPQPGIDISNLINQPQPFNFKMVILVRQDLNMGVGKVAAQVGHGVLGAYKNILESKNSSWTEALNYWEDLGQAKIVLKVKNKEDMLKIYNDAKSAGLNTCIIADAGRTQVEPGSFTVLAIGPGKSGDIDKITGHLKLL